MFTGLLMFYLQRTCQKILLRKFDDDLFLVVVNANRLVREALEDSDVPVPFRPRARRVVDYARFRMQLKCDFLALSYLLKNACNARHRFSYEERLLMIYFRALFVVLALVHLFRLNERAIVLKLASILEYFANLLGERRAWKAKTDVMVEYNGTLFLVYPVSDVGREWLHMNMFRNTQRLGDIQLVEPGHLYELVEAMLGSDLGVVWSPTPKIRPVVRRVA
jgi:hypothetical protein